MDYRVLRKGAEAIGFEGVFSMEVCRDIRKGLYGWDLNSPEDVDAIRRCRDCFLELYFDGAAVRDPDDACL